MLDWLINAPNWLKPLPGLLVLLLTLIIYLNGYFWPWGLAVGAVLLIAGLELIKKDNGYRF